jgi:methylated-DNA-protein-cysteine methyltransferase-like protein
MARGAPPPLMPRRGRARPQRTADSRSRRTVPERADRRLPRRSEGTYERIWSVVRRVPRGRVATYGQVAALAGFASQPRLAGYALHALPAESAVPWHRIVNARGCISLPAIDGQYSLQRAMLEAEGIVFLGERIDLRRHGWKAPARRCG